MALLDPIVLRGRHAVLEPLSLSHVPALRALSERWPYEKYPWAMVPLPHEVEEYVRKAMAQKALAFATCTPGGEVVGSTRLFDLQRWDWPYGKDPRAGADVFDACEIGYTYLAPEVQRTRLNTEAKLLMLRHAFEAWKCLRVTLKTDERNDRSRNAILRLGAHFDGILRAFQPATDGAPRNTAYFTILASEWPSVQERLIRRLAG